ncbi:MAG: CRISPR-associated protein Cas4 [Chloroflexota bacterium]|nr:CRISPR-associated protein Cas4 [Chloroflexota bacterium]NOG62325.1 CRISPR-associated protein Cas4 [Chloroflexota bacterium]GIK65482.1 MAG: CRISPR-associated protein Cas4 [Chloroflexota bacterium]
MISEDYLPISRINQFVYCPRRFWLVFIEDSMQIDTQVLEGIVTHKVVHANSADSNRCTNLSVVSHRLKITGLIDVAEPILGGFRIIEHKRGSVQAWENDQVQITAQAIAFEETTSAQVLEGSVFSWRSRRRDDFVITPELREQVEVVVQSMVDLLTTGMRPAPIQEKHKCKNCSVRDVCQPTLVQKINRRTSQP